MVHGAAASNGSPADLMRADALATSTRSILEPLVARLAELGNDHPQPVRDGRLAACPARRGRGVDPRAGRPPAPHTARSGRARRRLAFRVVRPPFGAPADPGADSPPPQRG